MNNINRQGGTLGMDDGVLTPSLKEQFLKLLESKVDALEEMSNILKIEGTQYTTVCELVRSYEERSGQLSLDEWKNILAHFGFGKYYHQYLAAHQRVLMASGVSSFAPPLVNTQVEPSSGAIPKKRSTQQQLHKANDNVEPADTGSGITPAVAENFSISQLPVSGLDMTGESEEKFGKEYQSVSEWPPQSLSPREENGMKDAVEGNKDQFQQSNAHPSRPNSPEEARSLQNPLTLVTGHLHRSCENSSMAVVCHPEESGRPAENDEAKSGAEAQELTRNTSELLDSETQELIRKTHEMYIAKEQECKRLVEYIRQQDQRYDRANVQVEMLKKENKELSEELHSVIGQMEKQQIENEQKLQEEHGKLLYLHKRMAEVSEGFHNSERKKVKTMEAKLVKETSKVKRIKMQLARERCKRKRVERELARAKSKGKKMEKRNKKVCKKNEGLKRNESFLVQELREKTVQLDNCQARYNHLQQDLEEFRARILAELQSAQTANAEWQGRFEESTELIAETRELCRKATQMYLWKEQECERMREHIRQHDQKYDNAKREGENLTKEFQESQEELHSVFKQVEELRLEYHNKQKLLEERELDLDRRMAEMSQAFCNAETDRTKIMKVKLAEETSKRRKLKRQLTKERNKRKRVELEKANAKRRGKRVEKRKKVHACQCLRKEEKGDGPSGCTYGGYGSHVLRDHGELSSSALSEEEASERVVTTCSGDSIENELPEDT